MNDRIIAIPNIQIIKAQLLSWKGSKALKKSKGWLVFALIGHILCVHWVISAVEKANLYMWAVYEPKIIQTSRKENSAREIAKL